MSEPTFLHQGELGIVRWWLCVKEAAGSGPADGGSGSNIVGTTPDDVLSDRVGRLVNGGQPRRGGRGLLTSVPPLDLLFAAPACKLAATYRMGLELARISLGETVVGGLREEARLG
ncbi:MAG: hypothetical protein M3072_11325 [Candidatus Dormibacteraeota bacterium]|nr:hypothetical protein [Candidatus Dormibacteraeota bacterium]